jgi:hypothetical protein
MALTFNPPDWLIQEYVNRKTPIEEASIGLQTALQTYLALDESKRRNAAIASEAENRRNLLDIAKQREMREGMAQFRDTGDINMLPKDQQAELLAPVQGPANIVPAYDENIRQAELGQAQGPGIPIPVEQPPQRQLSPLVQASMNFLRENKDGYKGLAAQKTRAEIEKDQAIADMYRRGGPSANKGVWRLNPVTGEQEWFPTTMPPGSVPGSTLGGGGSQPSPVPNADPLAGLDYKTRMKRLAEKPKAEGSLTNTLHEYDNMIAEAEAIKNDKNLVYATGMLKPLGSIPGTAAKTVAARLETLKAKTLLNVLSSLKELSNTGASGFGQLSNIEGENIRNSITTLDPELRTDDFKSSLDRFIGEMKNRKNVLRNTFSNTYGAPTSMPQQSAQVEGMPSIGSKAEYDALPSGSTYLWNGKQGRKP